MSYSPLRRIVPLVARQLTLISMRSFAAASAQAQQQPATGGAADGLRLTFASPEKAIYSDTPVKQVDVPTLAGMVGILAQHVPTIGMLKPGVLQIHAEDGKTTKYFVSSGTLAMNIDGTVQVLAEYAVPVEEIDESEARQQLETAQRKANEGSEMDKAEAQIRVEVAEALLKAASGQTV